MRQLLHNRRLGRRGPDRIAVCRDDADCRQALTPCGGGRRRICDADDRSFRRGVAVVGSSTRSLGSDHPRCSSLGSDGPRWVTYAIIVAGRMRVQTIYQPDLEDRLFNVLVPLAAYAILALYAIAALSHTHKAL